MTANSRLLDESVGHAVDLQQYANGVVRRIIALLNRVDSELVVRLTDALDNLPATTASVERLDALLASVRELNARAYRDAGQELTEELRKLVDYEAGHQLALFQSSIPAQVAASVGLAAVNAEQVYAAAMSRPFQGRLLREWARDIEADRMRRVRDAVRMGFVEQETIPQIVRRIRGTRARGYSDGLLEIDRRAAEAVVRTAISHTAGFTRDRFYEQNDDLIKAVVWTATLDTRTREECRIRDGLKYTPTEHKPLGHSIPWSGGPGRLHWNCRSTAVPVTKSWKELGLDIEEFTPTERASMDGTVPADQTFGAWIKRQSASRQNEVLGEARAKLMRDGGLTLDRFYNDKGRYLSLDELKARDAKAFTRAGIGP